MFNDRHVQNPPSCIISSACPREPLIRRKRPIEPGLSFPRIANRSSDSQGLSNSAPHVIGPNSSDHPGRSAPFRRGAFEPHITLGSRPPQRKDAMTLTTNKQIVQTFYDSANCGDMESCMDQLADDVTWTNIGSTKYSGAFHGKADLVARLLQPVFGQLQAGITSVVDNVVAEGDWVVVQSRGKAETKDGRPYNNTYCHVFRIRSGKIVEVTEYLDTELASAVLQSSAA